jgi:ABC-2 type transport system ATP-binding protein
MALDLARGGRRRRPGPARVAIPAAVGPPLVLEGLSKRFKDDVVAVDHLSLRVDPGQVVGLLGPNGAGKTTTLRMAVGLVRPTAGRALVFGQEMRPGHPVLHRVGTMIEGPGFVPHLSGLDNLRLWWRAGGRPVEDADLQGALAVAGLGEAVRRSVRTYSHGMKQRLALAQALLGRPDLLVLDEPTNGLDPQQIREVRELVAGMAAEGRTILLSSHLLAEVEQVCSHVAVMSDGKLVASGPVSEIIGADRLVYVEVSNARRGQRVLEQLLGPGSVSTDQSQPGSRGLVVSLDGMSRSELVAALVGAGVGVQTVMVRRHLEDAVLGLLEEER